MSKVYTIVPVNWEYNDEYYFQEGFDLPKATFKTIELAKKAVEDLIVDNIDTFSQYIFDGYMEDYLSSFKNITEFDAIFRKLTGMEFDEIESSDDVHFDLSKPSNRADFLRIIDENSFYKIVPMEVHDEVI